MLVDSVPPHTRFSNHPTVWFWLLLLSVSARGVGQLWCLPLWASSTASRQDYIPLFLYLLSTISFLYLFTYPFYLPFLLTYYTFFVPVFIPFFTFFPLFLYILPTIPVKKSRDVPVYQIMQNIFINAQCTVQSYKIYINFLTFCCLFGSCRWTVSGPTRIMQGLKRPLSTPNAGALRLL